MRLCEAWIEGTNGLIQNRFHEGSEASVACGPRRVQVTEALPREIAVRAAYFDPTGNLCVPGAAIARLLREAGSGYKQANRRKSLKSIVPAAVVVLEDLVPLFAVDRTSRLREFEVDSRPVVIPATRGRVMRHRPRIDAWTARLTLRINESLIPPSAVRQLLSDGGVQLGIGDYRPERGGPFGTFSIVSWMERPTKSSEQETT
jgi:hypothetical protein